MIYKIQSFVESFPIIAKPLKWIKHRIYWRYLRKKMQNSIKVNGKIFLGDIQKVFDELNIDFWLEFGTLLGAIREKNFIGHDIDIDIGVYLQDYDSKNEKVFNKYGFIKINDIEIDDGKYGRFETYKKDGIGVDIFYFRKDNDKMICHNFLSYEDLGKRKTIEKFGGLLISELTFTDTGFKKIEFLGLEVLVPKDTHLHLSQTYGDDYMIPNPNFTEYDNLNLKILPLPKVGKVKKYKSIQYIEDEVG